jgi:hypothetical protein
MKKLTLAFLCAVSAAQYAHADQAAALAVLRQGCADDAQRLCANVQPGGGRILACLQQNQTSLSAKCKQAAQQAATLNNAPANSTGASSATGAPNAVTGNGSPAVNVQDAAAVDILRQGCSDDAQRLCANVQPGGGRILDCLEQKKDSLSDKCKRATQKAESMSDASAPNAPPPPASH